MTRAELIARLNEDSFTRIGATVGGALGGGYHGYRQAVAGQDLERHLTQHRRLHKKPTKFKKPGYVDVVHDRDQLKKWVHTPGNVQSRIPVIGTPIKRFMTNSALRGYVPSTKKGWRGKVANWSFNKNNAAYMAPSNKEGRGVVIAHKHLPPEIYQHEFGHAKDFRGLTAKEIQQQDGGFFSNFGSHEKSPTYRAEVRAWKNAGVKPTNKYRKTALKTYEYGHKARKYGAIGATAGAALGFAGDVYAHNKGIALEDVMTREELIERIIYEIGPGSPIDNKGNVGLNSKGQGYKIGPSTDKSGKAYSRDQLSKFKKN